MLTFSIANDLKHDVHDVTSTSEVSIVGINMLICRRLLSNANEIARFLLDNNSHLILYF